VTGPQTTYSSWSHYFTLYFTFIYISRLFWCTIWPILMSTGAVGATNMNAHSSRSHAIFTVTIECSDKGPDGKQRVRAGKLHLVDLAVSWVIRVTTFAGADWQLLCGLSLRIVTVTNLLIHTIAYWIQTTICLKFNRHNWFLGTIF